MLKHEEARLALIQETVARGESLNNANATWLLLQLAAVRSSEKFLLAGIRHEREDERHAEERRLSGLKDTPRTRATTNAEEIADAVRRGPSALSDKRCGVCHDPACATLNEQH